MESLKPNYSLDRGYRRASINIIECLSKLDIHAVGKQKDFFDKLIIRRGSKREFKLIKRLVLKSFALFISK